MTHTCPKRFPPSATVFFPEPSIAKGDINPHIPAKHIGKNLMPQFTLLVSWASCLRTTHTCPKRFPPSDKVSFRKPGAAQDDTLSATVQNPASQTAINQAEPHRRSSGRASNQTSCPHSFPHNTRSPANMTAKPQHRLNTGPGGRDNLMNPAAKPMAPKGPPPQLPPKATGV